MSNISKFWRHNGVKAFLKLASSVVLLLLAVRLLDVGTMLEMLRQGSVSAFVSAIAINIFAFGIMGVRWHFISATKIESSLRSNLAMYLKATFFNTFTPANFGGDIYRLMKLKNVIASTAELLKLLLRERILGLYGYVVMFLIAYTLIAVFHDDFASSVDNPYLYGLEFAVAVLALPFLARPMGGRLALLLRAIVGKERLLGLEAWVDALATLMSFRGGLRLMLLTFSGIFLWVLSIQIVSAGFGLIIPTLHLVVVATLVELIRLVPITVQGIGLREGVFAYLLSFFGQNPEQSYVIGLTAYLALSVSIMLCGPIGRALMWRYEEKNRA